jgi:hypothetical protein
MTTQSVRLPGADRAILDARKLRDYLLSPAHPRGRHKARLLRAALGLGPEDADWLAGAILAGVQTAGAVPDGEDRWGHRWRVDMSIERHGHRAVLRSAWLMRPGESAPRFVTAWVT